MIETLHSRARERITLAVERARRRKGRVLLTLSAPIAPPEDLVSMVQQAEAHSGQGFLYERPAEKFAIAALGAAAVFSASGAHRFTEIAGACTAAARGALTDEPLDGAGPVFVGGFAFSPESPENDLWRGFPPGRLVLPYLVVVRRDRIATLTVAWMIDAGSEYTKLLRDLTVDVERMQHVAASPEQTCAESASLRYEAAPTVPLHAWKRAVADTLGDIAQGRVDKLVLARTCSVAANRPFDCGTIVRRLRQAYPSCALFWISTAQGNFLGATPEPLVRVNGRRISTAAVAGSAAPGTSLATAQALARALGESEKDRAEHAIVVRALAATLAPLCEQLVIAPAPQLLHLDNVQHLVTPITGQLTRPHHILDLVRQLHPSPAVAGYPREAALQLLRGREALDRGWYAGPVGWMDAHGSGEFAVAIRSAVVRGGHASLYAGAGIVAGSDPDLEVAETRLKLQPLLSALMEV
jgi:isochorismate synthase